jgi:hypothetical protein
MLIVARNQNRKLSDFMSEQKPVKLRSRKYRRIFLTIHFSELGLRPNQISKTVHQTAAYVRSGATLK